MSAPRKPNHCGPGLCRGHAQCADTYCPGHPANDPKPGERDPIAMRWFWLTYIAGILAALVLVGQADRLVTWLLG